MKSVEASSDSDRPEHSDYPTLTPSATEDTTSIHPAWYTPARLLIAFCVVSFLVYLDRGIIASNGVNGDKDSSTGIQVGCRNKLCWLLSDAACAASLWQHAVFNRLMCMHLFLWQRPSLAG